jgi:hypothetical protein
MLEDGVPWPRLVPLRERTPKFHAYAAPLLDISLALYFVRAARRCEWPWEII